MSPTRHKLQGNNLNVDTSKNIPSLHTAHGASMYGALVRVVTFDQTGTHKSATCTQNVFVDIV